MTPNLTTVHDALNTVAPPIELVELLEKYEQQQRLPANVAQWLNLWRALRTGSPLDGVTVETPPFAFA